MKHPKILFILFVILCFASGLQAQPQETHILSTESLMETPVGSIMTTDPADETETEQTFIEQTLEDEEDDGLISVNFQDADVHQVIKVLEFLTDTVIIPHEKLTGKITIESLDKVKPEVVQNVLESALMIKGFTLVRSGSALKIVPLPETKQSNVAVHIGASPAGIKDHDIVITQVMPLNYASANKLKTTLQPLIGKHGNILANERTNTLIVTDVSSNIRRLATIIAQMERPLPSKQQVKTYILNYGDAEKVSDVLNSLSQDDDGLHHPQSVTLPYGDGPYEIFGQIQAYFEEETNSIVVASAPVNFPSIERLIQRLDVFPPQAMIEVVILDVTLDDDFSMGIEFGDATTPSLTTQGAIVDLGSSEYKESTFHSLLGLATDAATSGFTYRLLNQKETLQALAFILDSQENSKVLSTPKILASNNKESSITVGQEIPIIESSTTDLVNNVTNTDFRYEDVGLILKVTPRISHDGYVNMTVHAELKDLSAQTILNASIINKREADATVIVPDGHTVVLGGLMRDNNSLVVKKIPFLGDIPILGVLFKKTETAIMKTELLVFLTPHVIKNTEDLIEISSDSKRKLEAMQGAQTSHGLEKAVQHVVGYTQKDAKNLDELTSPLVPEKTK